ncbi:MULTISPECIES: hypothetical protein [Acidithiobacillus]|uniref:Uncharacterized protein n=2 Tax=Acidithiobacillus TaxID=119977 RepID=A0A179B8T3_ACIFR|nr:MULTISPECIES: hypothetical protein [Acidithiobacillus]MEB8486757.1 hypothetical protein [Acidithiobacillus ferriphilus]MEB8488640.1 hypothetical protein [Acidithiobacillus ferriphilus]MEB8493281.1 hypothetical protein [Acidithiobacillus ferriphilus]MEB8513694.1 hypothetical protein [Acidithiobacillus ferriphilus]MEB8522707.1 hypothetical protein [Acidithiobacillus ferriphilus]
MADKLVDLIREGPDMRYAMKSVVLARYADIATARSLLRTWADIADALGFGKSRGKDLAGCFTRVAAGVKKGRLKPQGAIAHGGLSGRPAAEQKNSSGAAVPKSGRINLDDPENQL